MKPGGVDMMLASLAKLEMTALEGGALPELGSTVGNAHGWLSNY